MGGSAFLDLFGLRWGMDNVLGFGMTCGVGRLFFYFFIFFIFK